MSDLLVSERHRTFSPLLAECIGLNKAIALQQVRYWMNLADDAGTMGVIHDNKRWIYNTFEEWKDQFPWWSLRTIKKLFSELEKDGYLVTDYLNKNKYNRTKFYTIDLEKVPSSVDAAAMRKQPKDVENKHSADTALSENSHSAESGVMDSAESGVMDSADPALCSYTTITTTTTSTITPPTLSEINEAFAINKKIDAAAKAAEADKCITKILEYYLQTFKTKVDITKSTEAGRSRRELISKRRKDYSDKEICLVIKAASVDDFIVSKRITDITPLMRQVSEFERHLSSAKAMQGGTFIKPPKSQVGDFNAISNRMSGLFGNNPQPINAEVIS